MTKKQFAKLKPSQLIRVAIADLREVEKDKRYSVYMADWHSPANDISDTCTVCLAGAAMAKSLKTPITEDVAPVCFDLEIRKRLSAINDFRTGAISYGVFKITGKPRHDLENRPVVSYCMDKAKFKRQMISIAKYLEGKKL